MLDLKATKEIGDHGLLKGDTQRKLLIRKMSKVKFDFSKKINPKEKEEKGVSLVVKYHPSLNYLGKILRDKAGRGRICFKCYVKGEKKCSFKNALVEKSESSTDLK